MSTSEYLANGASRYFEIRPGDLYELAVEGIIAQHALSLFPMFEIRRCQPRLRSPYGNAQPDLILIARDLSCWMIVEIELEEHSAAGHVQPQLAVFSNAEIDNESVSSICEAFNGIFDRSSVERVLFTRPRVLLITHGTCQVSSQHLTSLRVEAIDVRIFRAGANDYQLLVEDRRRNFRDVPGIFQSTESQMFPGVWTFKGAHMAEIPPGSTSIDVEVDGQRHQWVITQTADGYIFKAPYEVAHQIRGRRLGLAISIDGIATLRLVQKGD